MKKIALIFPGYGSQYVGMGKDIYDEYRTVQELFEEAYSCQNLNFVKLCFASSDQDLAEMVNAFQSIFLLCCALFNLLKELGVKPDVVTGQGIGYFASLFAGGSITLPDGLYLLNKLATFYEKILDNEDLGMIEITGIGRIELEKIIEKFENNNKLAIAMFKSKGDFLVGGYKEQLEKLADFLGKIEGVEVSDAPVEIGLYSDLMEEAAKQLHVYLEKVDFKDVEVPVIVAGRTGFLTTGQEIRDDLIESITRPFDWDQVLDELKEYDVIIEVGPRSKLSDLVKKYYPEKIVLTFGNKADVERIKKLFGAEQNS